MAVVLRKEFCLISRKALVRTVGKWRNKTAKS
jgi:hypothetical protein